MTCKSCEERRKKLKAMYDSSVTALQNVIGALTGKDNGTEANGTEANGTPTGTDGKSVEAAGTTKRSTSSTSK